MPDQTRSVPPASPWPILAAATVTSTLTGPGQTIGVSVFIDRFVDDLGLTRAGVSTAYLIGTLIGAALLPIVGARIDRHGVRAAQIAIGIGFSLALVNMSFVSGLLTLAVGFAGIRFLGQGSLSLVSTVTVSIAFTHNRGTALGIFATVSGALMATLPLGLAVVINAVGWRRAWLVAAAVVAAVVIPVAIVVLRGLGRTERTEIDDGTAVVGMDRATAIRTRTFWVLATVGVSSGMMGTALNFHQIDLLADAGLSATAAAALFIPQVLGSSISGITIGYLSDRVGTRFLPAVGMGLLLAAHGLAAVVRPGALVIIYAIVLGAMGGTVRTALASLLPKRFGTANIGAIQGSLTLCNVAASAIGPVALAVAEANLGGYPAGVFVLALVPAAALVFSLFDRPVA